MDFPRPAVMFRKKYHYVLRSINDAYCTYDTHNTIFWLGRTDSTVFADFDVVFDIQKLSLDSFINQKNWTTRFRAPILLCSLRLRETLSWLQYAEETSDSCNSSTSSCDSFGSVWVYAGGCDERAWASSSLV